MGVGVGVKVTVRVRVKVRVRVRVRASTRASASESENESESECESYVQACDSKPHKPLTLQAPPRSHPLCSIGTRLPFTGCLTG